MQLTAPPKRSTVHVPSLLLATRVSTGVALLGVVVPVSRGLSAGSKGIFAGVVSALQGVSYVITGRPIHYGV
jgi:hypothetical protein